MELTPTAPANEPKQIEKALLTEIAQEAHVSNWNDLRWFVVGNPPRSIVVVRRGKHPKQVLSISKTNNADVWETWQPVLKEWLAMRTNGKRVDHGKLQTGEIK